VTEHGQVRYGSSTISYTVNRSGRRKKTVEITVDGHTGVLVAAPEGVPRADIDAIVRRRASWILRKASPAVMDPQPRQFVSGESLPYLGRRVRMIVVEGDGSRPLIRFRHWSFEVLTPLKLEGEARRDAIRRALIRWYKGRAQQRLEERVKRWSAVLGQHPTEVLIRDQRQRWASCAPDGTVRFNWRVIMAEPAMLDYVVVHELAHLTVKNHSADFWIRVASALPDYAVRRRRLRELGPYLSL